MGFTFPKVFDVKLLNQVVQSPEYLPGQTIRCGFVWFKIASRDGLKYVMSPGFVRMPIEWVDDLSSAQGLLMSQIEAADRYGGVPDSCHMMQTLICPKTPLPWERMALIRNITPSERESGWLINDLDGGVDLEDPVQMQAMTLYEASVRFPFLARFFQLPSLAIVHDFHLPVQTVNLG